MLVSQFPRQIKVSLEKFYKYKHFDLTNEISFILSTFKIVKYKSFIFAIILNKFFSIKIFAMKTGLLVFFMLTNNFIETYCLLCS